MDDTATQVEPAAATLQAHNVHVRYRVYEDRRPQLREVVSNGFRRPSYREIHAVRGVTLTARRGEAIGLIGRNGSGKSSLLRVLAGLMPADEGEVYASSQPMLMGVGAALRGNVSGRRNIVLGGLALGMSRDEIMDKMQDIIDFTGLAESIDLPIRTYSSGMRARLHFGIATSVQPEILMIDEALATGDAEFRERSQARIDELIDRAGTVFLVTHSLGTLRETCTRCLWLNAGEIVMDGAAEDVVDAYEERVAAGS